MTATTPRGGGHGVPPVAPLLVVLGVVIVVAIRAGGGPIGAIRGGPLIRLSLLAAGLVALAVTVAWVRRRARRRWRSATTTGSFQVLITPPPESDMPGADALWRTLRGILTTRWRRWWIGQPHVCWEYTWSGRGLRIGIWVPVGVAPAVVAQAVTAAWPGATVRTVRAQPPLPAGPRTWIEGGQLRLAADPRYPLRSTTGTTLPDPLRPLLATATHARTGDGACVQIIARPAPAITTSRWLPRLLDTLVPAPAGGAAAGRAAPSTEADPLASRRASAALEKATEPGWEVTAYYAVTTTQGRTPERSGPVDDRAAGPADDRVGFAGIGTRAGSRLRTAVATGRQMLHDAAGDPWPGRAAHTGLTRTDRAIAQRLTGRAHAIAAAFAIHTSGYQAWRSHRLADPRRVLTERWPSATPDRLSTPELATIAHLPIDAAVPELDRTRARPVPAPAAASVKGGRDVRTLGTTPGGQTVRQPVADARHHTHVLGATGSGKSTFLSHQILGDIRAGRAVVLVDPNGDLVDDVLDRMPASVADRVTLIDPDQPAPYPCFAPLGGEDPDLAVDQLCGIFSSVFVRAWGPRADDTLRAAGLTLAQYEGASLDQIPALLSHKGTRARLTGDLDDPAGLGGYWSWYEGMQPGMQSQVISPVLSRLRAFLLRDFVRATVGGPHTTLNMRRILDKGGILLCRLPKGVLGDPTCRLLGSMIVASVWQATTTRVGTAKQKRPDAALYLDECHNFLTVPGLIDIMLAEARGYRLALTLAHQNMTQLPEDMRESISSNARNKVVFAVSPRDATQLAKHTEPFLTEDDLRGAGRFTAACQLVIDHETQQAFTLYPPPPAREFGAATDIRATAATAAATAIHDAETAHERRLGDATHRHGGVRRVTRRRRVPRHHNLASKPAPPVTPGDTMNTPPRTNRPPSTPAPDGRPRTGRRTPPRGRPPGHPGARPADPAPRPQDGDGHA